LDNSRFKIVIACREYKFQDTNVGSQYWCDAIMNLHRFPQFEIPEASEAILIGGMYISYSIARPAVNVLTSRNSNHLSCQRLPHFPEILSNNKT
jgi:hypothetical protein